MSQSPYVADDRLDLVLERVIDVPPALVWTAWTDPEHLMPWFTPLPWKTVECEIDLRPGGLFRTVMQSPEGENFPNVGCYLDIEKGRRLAWTSALGPGFRPLPEFTENGKPCAEIIFTAVISIEPHGDGTKYTALVMHRDEKGRKQHEEMGFHEGWGTALDQLVAFVKKS